MEVTVTLDLRTSYGDLQAGAELWEMMAMQDNGQGHLAFVACFVIYTIDIMRVLCSVYYNSTKNSNKNTIFNY